MARRPRRRLRALSARQRALALERGWVLTCVS
jgi:hypothetical protein